MKTAVLIIAIESKTGQLDFVSQVSKIIMHRFEMKTNRYGKNFKIPS